jgi:hypothetical protein
MTEHPITPPPELFKQWEGQPRSIAFEAAYRAGADMELEACCEWLANRYGEDCHAMALLRSARRPKPPSLKEQALAELNRLIALIPTEGALAMAEPIRAALEALPND